MSSSCIWLIDRNLSDATTSGQSGYGSNGNEEILHIPQSSKTGWLVVIYGITTIVGYLIPNPVY